MPGVLLEPRGCVLEKSLLNQSCRAPPQMVRRKLKNPRSDKQFPSYRHFKIVQKWRHLLSEFQNGGSKFIFSRASPGLTLPLVKYIFAYDSQSPLKTNEEYSPTTFCSSGLRNATKIYATSLHDRSSLKNFYQKYLMRMKIWQKVHKTNIVKHAKNTKFIFLVQAFLSPRKKVMG